MEPFDPHDPGQRLPLVELTRGGSDDDTTDDGTDDTTGGAPDRPARLWWYVGATAVLAVVALVVGIVVFNSAASDPTRGTHTAREAAAQFARALNAGDGDSAAGISCDTFLDSARAEARSGEQGIRYRLASVRQASDDTATAVITARLTVAGQTQTDQIQISVFRSGGLWLVCGQD